MSVQVTSPSPANRRQEWRRNPTGGVGWRDAPRIYVDDYITGAIDGSTDNTADIHVAMNAAYALSADINHKVVLEFNGDKSYSLARRVSSSATLGGIYLKRGVCLDGHGAKLVLSGNTAFIQFKLPTSTDDNHTATVFTSITVDVAVGDSQLTVTSTTGFSAGDVVYVRLNENPSDSTEVKDAYYANVVSVDSSTTLTLDQKSPVTCTVASVVGALNKRVWRLSEPIENIFVRNFALINPQTGSANAEYGIMAGYARNCLFENIIGEHVGAGLIAGGYMEDITIRNCHVRKCDRQGGASSKGRCLNFWNAKNILVDGFKGEQFEGAFSFNESYSRNVRFHGLHLINNHSNRDNANIPLLTDAQGSSGEYDGVLLEGNGGTSLFDSGGTAQYVDARNIRLNTNSIIKSSGPLSNFNGSFMPDWNTEFKQVKHYAKRMYLKASSDVTFTDAPDGQYRKVWVYASATTGLTDAYIYTGASAGINYATAGAGAQQLVAATNVHLTTFDQYGSSYAGSGTYTHSCRFVTDGTWVYGGYIDIEIEYWALATDDTTKAMLQSSNAMPLAYTQTYSTADRTHADFTSADLVTTAATQTTPWGFGSQAQADAIATQVNALRVDLADLKQLVNAIIDDMQAREVLT